MSQPRVIKVRYQVVLETEQEFQKAYENAKEFGHAYNDAGPIETITRALIDEGVNNVLPEKDFGVANVTVRRVKK